MGTGYTRQSAASIQTDEDITAAPLNAEFNAIQSAFDSSSGHSHDGTSGEGPTINLTTSVTGVLPVARGGVAAIHKIDGTTAPTVNDDSGDGYGPGSIWVDTTNDIAYICLDATATAAVWVRISLALGSGGAQAYDAGLASIAGLTTAADKMIYTTASDTYAVTALTSFARSILDDTDEATFKATVNLEPGVDVQAYDADLAALAGVTSAADKVPYFTGSGTADVATFTSYGRSIVAVANEAAFKSLVNLEAGTDVQAWDANLDSLAGVADVSHLTDIGGLTLASGDLLYANATPAITNLAKGSDGQVLTLSSGLPVWAAAAGVTALDDVGDVTITTIASGELLKWNGSAWINNTLAEAGVLGAADFTADGEILVGTGSGTYTAESGATLRTSIGVSTASTYDEATAAQYQAATADKLLVSDTVWSAMAETALTSSTNAVAWDMSGGIDFKIDTLGENTTIGAPTNTTVGKKGRLRIVQDATGGRTVAWNAVFEFAGGSAPTASTAASAEDVFYYDVITSSRILISPVLNIS